jgi:hypothetical protein
MNLKVLRIKGSRVVAGEVSAAPFNRRDYLGPVLNKIHKRPRRKK